MEEQRSSPFVERPQVMSSHTYPENDNRSLQAKNRQLQLKDRNVLLGCNNLMPMVVKIVGSTPTTRTINESEVVVSKHVKSNI